MNPWIARARKFIAFLITAVIILGNGWVDGPTWLTPLAIIAGAAGVYFAPNAPKYVDPHPRNLR